MISPLNFGFQVSMQAAGTANSTFGVDFLRAPDGSEVTTIGSSLSNSTCSFTTTPRRILSALQLTSVGTSCTMESHSHPTMPTHQM